MNRGRQAYGTLGDPEKRRRYDDSGRYDGDGRSVRAQDNFARGQLRDG